MTDSNSKIDDRTFGPGGPIDDQNILSSDAELAWTISALKMQSRGFLQVEQVINVMGLGVNQSSGDRDANLDRILSKLDRVLDKWRKQRKPK